jgi:organic hydroperoxide reductase OsmC/OhrA
MTHSYKTSLRWTGNKGTGTSDYRAYGRDHELAGTDKSATIAGSADPHFRGEASRYNPEELLVASLSACHLLSYLHVCAVNGVVVTAYEDEAVGSMALAADGSGRMTGVTLRPRVTITRESDPTKALALHDEAHHKCFIANSVNFPVGHEAEIVIQQLE